jgi:hypothetical protein
MNIKVSRESEDGLELREWHFSLVPGREDQLTFEFLRFDLWRRSSAADGVPWDSPPDKWRPIDLLGRFSIKEKPDVPQSVIEEAKQWILLKTKFKI